MLASHEQREHARIQVRRGYEPQTTQRLSLARPIRNGQEIWSGMVMHLDTNADNELEFVQGGPASSETNHEIYFALNDYFDSSVRASGKIAGLSSRDDYVIETVWFKTEDAYQPEGTPLTWDAGTGRVTATTWASDDVIIGVTSADPVSNENPIDRSSEYSEADDAEYLRFTTIGSANRSAQ